MTTSFYTFIAIQGQQGQHTYYLIQCPLILVPRLFLFDEREVPETLRKVRSIDSAHVTELTDYLTTRSTDYVLTTLVAAINCEVDFAPLIPGQTDIGKLQIPLTAHLILHDGQHRRIAIQQVLEQTATLSNDTIPVMLFPDPQLTFSPKLYTDLQQNRIQRSRSQRVLHDRGDLAVLVRELIDKVPIFQGLIEVEKTTISNRSTALFTLSAVYQATQALLGVGNATAVSAEQAEIARQFWHALGSIIPEWQQIIRRDIAASSLRQHFVHSHSVTLLAIGIAGHTLITSYPDDWPERLRVLTEIDWSRENTALWEGRAMIRGRMSKARDSVQLTSVVIKRAMGLPLTDKDQELEQSLHRHDPS